jgi:hypothetical protein
MDHRNSMLARRLHCGPIHCRLRKLLDAPTRGDSAGAMKDSVLRFYAVEHLAGMLLAVVVAQVGYSISKRAPTDRG